jgi:hypothetical protein
MDDRRTSAVERYGSLDPKSVPLRMEGERAMVFMSWSSFQLAASSSASTPDRWHHHREAPHGSPSYTPRTRRPRCASVHAAEQRRLLGGAPFFAPLPATDMDDLATAFRQADYAAGRVIHHAGDPAARLSIVAAGMVNLARPTPDGQDILLGFLGPGEHFGSLAGLAMPSTARTPRRIPTAASSIRPPRTSVASSGAIRR